MRPIYFSGSISGGRGDLEIYRRLVELLKAHGFQVNAGEVTSAEVGVGGSPLESPEVFERDLRWIEEVARAGGALIAEVTTPSHGVGYEIATARWRFGIPVVALFRPASGRRCSAMIAGDPGIHLVEYDEDDLEAAIDRTVACLREAHPSAPAGDAALQ
ncbi:MAG TPA: nucleoside 2-deoxyribosyltransferase [Thermoanaerobaculia bacterium]|nr:nucleoside 2-deoxyribosyltransferase [Thermoanaerobaculia bacterium]